MESEDDGARATAEQLAVELTRTWPEARARMARAALGLESRSGHKTSLETIARDYGVSRETVRRARDALARALHEQTPSTFNDSSVPLPRPRRPSSATHSHATAVALRRLLTMTGPLKWDEILTAWERAGGRAPYLPLPEREDAARAWVSRIGGVSIRTPVSATKGEFASSEPEPLDRVSEFLQRQLRAKARGVDRHAILEAAEESGLQRTTVSTALSTHPAVQRLGRGTWGLKGETKAHPATTAVPLADRKRRRVRATTFEWASNGELLIEFTIPSGPSPVLALPRAIADYVQEKDYPIRQRGKEARITTRNSRLWGFGPVASHLELRAGDRARLAFDLVHGSAVFTPADSTEEPVR